MDAALRDDTVHIALLADHVPGHAGQIVAVLVWTERGDRYYELLAEPIPAPANPSYRTDRHGPCQLDLELDDSYGRLTSGGLTWRTWLLDSVPEDLRHLAPDAVARALADRLAVRA